MDAVECTGDYFPSPAARRYVRNRHPRADPQLASQHVVLAQAKTDGPRALIRQETT